jgi:hypothetical protein
MADTIQAKIAELEAEMLRTRTFLCIVATQRHWNKNCYVCGVMNFFVVARLGGVLLSYIVWISEPYIHFVLFFFLTKTKYSRKE